MFFIFYLQGPTAPPDLISVLNRTHLIQMKVVPHPTRKNQSNSEDITSSHHRTILSISERYLDSNESVSLFPLSCSSLVS